MLRWIRFCWGGGRIAIDKEAGLTTIIAEDVLKKMFEGEDEANEILKKMKEMDDVDAPFFAITTMSSFLRAIYLADPKTNINNIQKTLSFLQIVPSVADFKKEEAVMDEIIKFAGAVSGGMKKWMNTNQKQ